MSRFEGGNGWALVCGYSLSIACAIDNRPTRVVEMQSGNAVSGSSSDGRGGAAGSSNEEPGGSIEGGSGPGGSTPNAEGIGSSGEGTPAPPLVLNGNGASGTSGTAGGPSMMMGSSGSAGSTSQGTSGSSGSGLTDPGESEAIGGCFNQLLSNAGFERGHVGWTEISEAVHDGIVHRDDPLLQQTGVAPQIGDYLGWIGGIPSGEFRIFHSSLVQDIVVPSEALSLTMSGYYWASQPQPGLMPFDWAVLQAEDPNPNVTDYWEIQLFNEDNLTTGWVHFEITTTETIAALAGKTVRVTMDSRPNGSGTLSVFFDSLRLEARCPR